MKFKTHYYRGDYEDDFIVSGESIEEVKNIVREFFSSRNLDAKDCDAWSEEIRERGE